MTAIQIATSILTLIAGVGVFLVACSMMSSNLESLGSKRLKTLFNKASKSKLVGVGVGTVTTAAIQSSSATTVMVIGFVNAGIMTLAQAATVIFGANIGTTITGQLVALGMFGNSISTSVIFAAFAGIGAFILAFAKKDNVRKIGGIMAGFGMIFVGLSLMSGAMNTFAESDALKQFLSIISNPLLLVLIGALLTAVIQSSSVMTSITITMVVTGLISLNQGIYITMGANIGTCITALIAGITSGRNAKRAALIHVIFNVSGVILFLLIGLFLQIGGIDFEWLFEKIIPNAPQTQLAMFHTVFNLLTVIIILPVTNLLVKLVTKIIPEKKRKDTEQNEPRLYFVEEHMLATPPIAVQQIKNEIVNMAQIAMQNVVYACDIICTLDYTQSESVKANENELNFINKQLVIFIVKLLKSKLGEKDRIYLSTAIRSISDLERIGDYAENIVEYADNLKNADIRFSDDAVKEIDNLKKLVKDLYETIIVVYKDCDVETLKKAYAIEENIDEATRDMAHKHIARLSESKCTPIAGAQYLSLSSNVERIADHFINVAKTVKEYK